MELRLIMCSLAGLPAALRHYGVAVVIGGPLLAWLVAATMPFTLAEIDLLRLALLTGLAILAARQPLQFAHGSVFYLTDAAFVAMVLVFPTPVTGLLALVAFTLGRVRRWGIPVWSLFDVGQTVLYVTCGALAAYAMRGLDWLGPEIAGLASLGSIVACAIAFRLVNAAMVAGAVRFHTGTSFLRSWQRYAMHQLPAYATLISLGVVAALILRDYPLALPVLALPVVLVHDALRQGVQLQTNTHQAIGSLVDIVELRDPYTADHSRRVAEFARDVALRMGLTADEADLIETAGRVHDIGKVAMDPAILLKFGPLTEPEWGKMRQHPVMGAEVLSRFDIYRPVVPLVRHHHERWDGAGYPDQLAREDIPIGARILAVADSFDAMTTNRSYRPARGPDAALRVLEEGAGSQWDPRVVATAIALLHDSAADPAPALTPRAVPA